MCFSLQMWKVSKAFKVSVTWSKFKPTFHVSIYGPTFTYCIFRYIIFSIFGNGMIFGHVGVYYSLPKSISVAVPKLSMEHRNILYKIIDVTKRFGIYIYMF